ncbi:MAG TPA: hypothetical protein VLT36_14735, partial [Candidatus Dormibacteraeota bacterium]|nr:hypothetical protein [Candidatus Dormibacteraeota bacterium]
FLGHWHADAQFYAPRTEFHDPVQRVFIVEAARILAWWNEPYGSTVSEITYDVTTRPDQTTIWSVHWLGANGKSLKDSAVNYPADLLKQGPEFYRTVWKQLSAGEWKKSPDLDPAQVNERYWRGAAKSGLSREENVLTAERMLFGFEKKQPADWMPELAGLLSHSALACYSERTSLDAVLLARGAAWLAMMEQGSSKLDRLWAPILFQAGREKAGAKLWEAPSEPQTPQQAGWSIWVRQPPSRELFAFAVPATNWPMAMPMLAWDAKVNSSGPALAALADDLFGKSKLPLLHNYAPLFTLETSVRGGQLTEGFWPVYSRMAWLRLLGSFPAKTNEYRAYLGLVRTATNDINRIAPNAQMLEACLRGFMETAPVLKLAAEQGVGSLSPTAVATTRDLLNYGWEMAGWQFGARYEFLLNRTAGEQSAEPINRIVTADLPSLRPFFVRQQRARISGYNDYLKRLEMVEGLGGLVGPSPPPPDTGETEAQAAVRFARSAWLRPGDLSAQTRALWDEDGAAEVDRIIHTYQEQGGALDACAVLGFLEDLDPEERRKLPDAKDLQATLGEALPQPTLVQADALFEKKYRSLDNFTRAQEYEKLYWQNPDGGLERRAIYNYIISGSFKAAKRFYMQARAYFNDPTRVSAFVGRQIYIMALFLHDEPLRKQALKDSECGSRADYLMRIWEAGLHDDLVLMEKTARELSQRYEQREHGFGMGTRLLEFIPMMHSLREPNDPKREDALDFFDGDPRWEMLAYIILEKLRVSRDDFVRLLGGREVRTPMKEMMLAYFDKDQPKALEAFTRLTESSGARNEQIVLAALLYNKLHPLSEPHEEPDLKPATPEPSLKQVVLKAKGR